MMTHVRIQHTMNMVCYLQLDVTEERSSRRLKSGLERVLKSIFRDFPRVVLTCVQHDT